MFDVRTLLLPLIFVAPALAQVPPAQVPNGVAQIAPAPTAAQQLRAGRGSLFRGASVAGAPSQAAQVSLFSVEPPEPRTLKKHDLVTIIVREESNSSSEGTTDLKKDAAVVAKLNEFVDFDLGNARIRSKAGVGPGVNFTASREMTGDATVDRKDMVTLRITAEVLDVKPNDTVVLQARKQIKIDDEEQLFVISGTCRAEDLTADNTILSTQLGDLNFSKKTKGAVRDNTRRGWLTKLLDHANPF
jgi:flagellar L-ring protein precursor FlgH